MFPVNNNLYQPYIKPSEVAESYFLPSEINHQTTDFKQLLRNRIQMAMSLNETGDASNNQMHSMMSQMLEMFSSQTNTFGSNMHTYNGMNQYNPQFGAHNQFSTPNNTLQNQSYDTRMNQAMSAYNNTLNPLSDVELTKVPPTSEFNHLINKSAAKYNVDPNLIHAIIKMESNYNPDVVSHAGAAGLMQLMPVTAKAVGVTDRFDNAQNIDGGTHYFKKMLDRHNGDLTLALASYNAGPGNVKKYGGVPPFKETQNYIKKVTDYYYA